jgi:Xaa-Pro aminopeptidase
MGRHGYPWINRGVDFVIRPDMVMALEPQVTMFDRPDVGGVELESVVLVTETGCEVLNKVPCEEHLL